MPTFVTIGSAVINLDAIAYLRDELVVSMKTHDYEPTPTIFFQGDRTLILTRAEEKELLVAIARCIACHPHVPEL